MSEIQPSLRSQIERVLPSMDEMRSYRIWDGHIHMTTPGATPEERLGRLIELADNMGIERLILARGVPPYSRSPDPAKVRKQNNDVLRALKHHPERALATVYLNPHHVQASLDELNRCVRDGPCVGIKLWVAARVNIQTID